MNTAPQTTSRVGTFALVFGVCFAILYVICDLAALPLFTYHPGTDRIDPGFAPPRRDEGPAMYWYGWVATSVLLSTVLGLLVSRVSALRRLTSWHLSWVVPLAMVPVMAYTLKVYWR